MWSCTRARWAMRISDELNRFEKGLCRVAGPFFCVKGTAFSGTGGTDCHDQFANWFRNDRVFARSAVQVRRQGEGTPPYGTVCRDGRPCPPGPDNATPCRAGPVCPAVGAGKTCRADVGIGPYGSATRGAMGGRPQGSPLRMGCKRYGGQATMRVAHTEAGLWGHEDFFVFMQIYTGKTAWDLLYSSL